MGCIQGFEAIGWGAQVPMLLLIFWSFIIIFCEVKNVRAKHHRLSQVAVLEIGMQFDASDADGVVF